MKKFLDLSGVRCPMAFVRCKHELFTLALGDSLQVLLDDIAAIDDIVSWAQGHAMICHKNQLKHGLELTICRDSNAE